MEVSKTHSPLHEPPFLHNKKPALFEEEDEDLNRLPYSNEISMQQFRYSPLPPSSKSSTTSFYPSPYASSNYVRGSRSSSPRPPPVIQVSHGCLLLPVFLAAWWYYTKSVCRKVVHGLIRSTPHSEQNESESYEERFFCFNDCYTKWYVTYALLFRVFLGDFWQVKA